MTVWAAVRPAAANSAAPVRILPAHSVFAKNAPVKAIHAHSAQFRRSGHLTMRTTRTLRRPRAFGEMVPSQRTKLIRSAALPHISLTDMCTYPWPICAWPVRICLSKCAARFPVWRQPSASTPISANWDGPRPSFRRLRTSSISGARSSITPPHTGVVSHSCRNDASFSAKFGLVNANCSPRCEWIKEIPEKELPISQLH